MHVLHCKACGWHSDVDVGMRPQCPDCGKPLHFIRFAPHELIEMRDALAQWAAGERDNDVDELANARAGRDRILSNFNKMLGTRIRTSPGEVLIEEFLRPLGDAWRVDVEMAQALAKSLGTTPEFWLKLQANHDRSKPST
jgi:hypothetical protein